MCLCVMIWALRASDSTVFFRLVCGPVICGWEGRGEGLGSGLVLWLLFELRTRRQRKVCDVRPRRDREEQKEERMEK